MSFIGIALRAAAYHFSEKEDDGMHFAETALSSRYSFCCDEQCDCNGPRRHRASSSIFPQVYGVGYLVMFRKYCISFGIFICHALAPEQLLLRMHPIDRLSTIRIAIEPPTVRRRPQDGGSAVL